MNTLYKSHFNFHPSHLILYVGYLLKAKKIYHEKTIYKDISFKHLSLELIKISLCRTDEHKCSALYGTGEHT